MRHQLPQTRVAEDRSSAYRFTYDTIRHGDVFIDVEPEELTQLKRFVQQLNQQLRSPWRNGKTFRVTKKYRLGKDNPYASLYRRGGPHYTVSSQMVLQAHGQHVDVYVHEVNPPYVPPPRPTAEYNDIWSAHNDWI